MAAKLSPHVSDYAEAVEEVHEKDLAFGYQNHRAPRLATVSELENRYKVLVEAVKNREGVEPAAAFLGSALVALYAVGDGEIKNPQIELFSSDENAAPEEPDEPPAEEPEPEPEPDEPPPAEEEEEAPATPPAAPAGKKKKGGLRAVSSK